MYSKIPDIFRWWRNILGSTLFVLQNSQNHLMYLPLKFPTNILIKIIEEFHKNSAVNYSCISNQNSDRNSWRIPLEFRSHLMGLPLNFAIKILIEILEEFHKILQSSSNQNYWRIPKLSDLILQSKFATKFHKDHITAELFKSI